MGRLEDIRTSILDMEPDDLREKIRHIREDRRIVKTVAKMPATKRKATGNKALNAIKDMTPAQKAKLLKDLMG
jgi:myosin heavy subunit